MINPWEILGLSPEASSQKIKKAFRDLAQKHHPDHEGDPEIFVQINRAFSLIKTEERRDKFRREGEQTTTTLRGKALEHLCYLLLSKVRQAEPLTELKYQHIINSIELVLDKKLITLKKDYKGLKASLKELEKIAERIECSEEENILQNALKSEVGSLGQTLSTIRKEMQVNYKAKKLLRSYNYRVELRERREGLSYINLPPGTFNTFP